MSTSMHHTRSFAGKHSKMHLKSYRCQSALQSHALFSTTKKNADGLKCHRISLPSILSIALLLGILFLPQTTSATTVPITTVQTGELVGTEPSNSALSIPVVHATGGEMGIGSDCSGSEGQWNCLTNSWQRCASQRWSVVSMKLLILFPLLRPCFQLEA